MGFIALILALLIEQGRPLPRENVAHNMIRWIASSVRTATDAGAYRYGVIGWGVVVLGTALLIWGLHCLCSHLHPIALFVFHVAVLYWTVGFRQFSHSFTEIQVALAAGDVDGARNILQKWLRLHDTDVTITAATQGEVCRLAIANALVQSHRHVFAPLCFYRTASVQRSISGQSSSMPRPGPVWELAFGCPSTGTHGRMSAWRFALISRRGGRSIVRSS